MQACRSPGDTISSFDTRIVTQSGVRQTRAHPDTARTQVFTKLIIAAPKYTPKGSFDD